jgi:hypothetical protein
MGRFSFVVLLEALFEIIGQSHVTLTLCRKTFDKIHVIRPEGPPSLKASEGVLPRANEPLQLLKNVHEHSKQGASPAKREREAGRMGGDSNPRCLSAHTLSRRAQSTTLSPIQASCS